MMALDGEFWRRLDFLSPHRTNREGMSGVLGNVHGDGRDVLNLPVPVLLAPKPPKPAFCCWLLLFEPNPPLPNPNDILTAGTIEGNKLM